jgi:peptide/nickel transport system substrate-binding protein
MKGFGAILSIAYAGMLCVSPSSAAPPPDASTPARVAEPEGAVSPAVPPVTTTSELVAAVQKELVRLGYDPGPLDGQMGPKTQGAIRRFQGDQGLSVDGEASEGLLARLQALAPGTIPPTLDPTREHRAAKRRVGVPARGQGNDGRKTQQGSPASRQPQQAPQRDDVLKGDAVYEFSDTNAVYGGTFRTSWPTLGSMDPHIGTAATTAAFSNMVYNGLLRLGQHMRDIELDLAESWTQINDVTYEFKLRKGVRFHDIPPVNGRELNAEDVKYSIERVAGLHGKKAEFAHRYYFEGKLASIETPDDYTIIFKTNEPYAPFINYVASAWSKIVPKEAVAEWGDLKSKACGSGPFILKEHEPGSHVSLVKHAEYFEEGLPYLDGIHIRAISKPSTYQAAFLSDQLDGVGLHPFQVDPIRKGDPDAKVYEWPGCFTRVIRTQPWSEGETSLRPPFNDKRVRQAVAHAIDKDRLLGLAVEGRGEVQIGHVPTPHEPWGLRQADQWQYNPEKAKKLLAEAGYPAGFSAELMTWNLPYMIGPAQVIREMLNEVGIEITINALPFGEYFNEAHKFKYEMALHIMPAGYDPEEWLFPYFGKRDKSNRYKWSDHELWEMIEKQGKIMDEEDRAAYIRDIQRRIMDEAMSQSLFTTNRYWTVKPYVHIRNYFHPGSAFTAESWWMEKH